MLNISIAIIFFCSGFALITGIAQLVNKHRSQQNFMLAGLLVCIALSLLHRTLFVYGELESRLWLGYFNLWFTYAIGPFLYFYYKVVFKSHRITGRSILLHMLIPILLFFLQLITMLLIPVDTRVYIIQNLFTHKQGPLLLIFRILFIGASLSALTYQTIVLKDLFGIFRLRELQGINRYMLLTVVFCMIAPLLSIIGIFLSDKEYLRVSILITCLTLIWMYFLGSRYPEFMNIIKKEISKKRYEKSQLHDIDADVINTRLLELMEDEKVFTNEDMSLSRLSGHLNITSHQLSEFLNRHRNVNFYTFITAYRIEEAKRLLLEDEDLTVLKIAFNVGFNSKSAFNSAFQKFTGTNPQSFRKSKSL